MSSESYMFFGGQVISEETHKKVVTLLDKLSKPEELKDNVVTRSLNLDNGNVTELQWEVAEKLTQVPKPTLTQIANELDKKNYNSIQKTRDAFAKNVIEAFVTVTFMLQDPDAIDLVMEIINR